MLEKVSYCRTFDPQILGREAGNALLIPREMNGNAILDSAETERGHQPSSTPATSTPLQMTEEPAISKAALQSSLSDHPAKAEVQDQGTPLSSAHKYHADESGQQTALDETRTAAPEQAIPNGSSAQPEEGEPLPTTTNTPASAPKPRAIKTKEQKEALEAAFKCKIHTFNDVPPEEAVCSHSSLAQLSSPWSKLSVTLCVLVKEV